MPGAAAYEVEVGTSPEFATGSKVCCSDRVTGTSLTPTRLLPNNTGNDPANAGYYWRVRAVNVNGKPGTWHPGPSFQKVYDVGDPAGKQLRVRDNLGDPLEPGNQPVDLDAATPYLDTSSPTVTWNPVPGASSYHVTVVTWDASFGCVWNAPGWAVDTASTSWTPLGASQIRPMDTSVNLAYDAAGPVDGRRYCVRVTARSGTDTNGDRVTGKSFELGNLSAPAFRYVAPPPPVPSGPVTMLASDYLSPVSANPATPRMPLFRWRAKEGVCAYFVVVARDASFTNVIDIARTLQPSYAPRLRTYPDETTAYYWAVLPEYRDPGTGSCSIVSTSWSQNSPQSFQKRSAPPVPIAPAEGAGHELAADVPLERRGGGSRLPPAGLPRPQLPGRPAPARRRDHGRHLLHQLVHLPG